MKSKRAEPRSRKYRRLAERLEAMDFEGYDSPTNPGKIMMKGSFVINWQERILILRLLKEKYEVVAEQSRWRKALTNLGAGDVDRRELDKMLGVA
jgi:hypothetical protein